MPYIVMQPWQLFDVVRCIHLNKNSVVKSII